MSEQWIGLLDCNNFFVSCERLFRPDLKRRPVVVLSSNDGCIVARSQEIKDKGIPMGIPYFQIKDILKDIEAVRFSSHFALYRDISRRVFEVMRGELNDVEQYSVDEAFFKISGDKEAVEKKIRILKDRVEQLVGIPVSVGVAASKTQAKYASSVAKKTAGICVLDQTEWGRRIATINLRDIWGVGGKSALEYKKHHVLTVADLLQADPARIERLFGVVGMRLRLELQGVSASGFSRRLDVQKSIMSSRSFHKTTTELEVLKDAVAYHVREAAEDLRTMGVKTACLQVSLLPSRHGDFVLQGGTAKVLLPPTNDTFVLLAAAQGLVEQLFRSAVPYKKAGILLSDFTPETVVQASLFSDGREEPASDLMPLIDAINQRSGHGTILLGSRLKSSAWQSSIEARSPAYTTKWTELATVKA